MVEGAAAATVIEGTQGGGMGASPLQISKNGPSFEEVLAGGSTEEAQNVAPVTTLVKEWGQEIQRTEAMMEGVLQRARRGGALDAGELLALQGDLYRVDMIVQVSSKAIEQGVGGLKQLMGIQV